MLHPMNRYRAPGIPVIGILEGDGVATGTPTFATGSCPATGAGAKGTGGTPAFATKSVAGGGRLATAPDTAAWDGKGTGDTPAYGAATAVTGAKGVELAPSGNWYVLPPNISSGFALLPTISVPYAIHSRPLGLTNNPGVCVEFAGTLTLTFKLTTT